MKLVHLFINEAKLLGHELRQYWFETALGIVVMVGVFCGLFYGIHVAAEGQTNSSSMEGLVFGFLLWSFASGTYNTVGSNIIEDNQKGLLEQLFMSPIGFYQLMLIRASVHMLWSMLLLTVMSYLVMAATGVWLNINFLLLFAVLILGAPALLGLSFFLSSFALVFKKVSALVAIIHIALMGIVALDALPLNVFSYLPFAPGASFARDLVLYGKPWIISDLMVVLANSTFYMVVGVTTFVKMECYAKRKNLLGQY